MFVDLVAAITKKCGVFYFIYQTCCGPPLDYKKNNDDKEEFVLLIYWTII